MSEPILALLALLLGGLLTCFSSGRHRLPLAAWLAPAFLLGLTRTAPPVIALPAVWLVLFAGLAEAYRGIMPLRRPLYQLVTLVQCGVLVLPYALDRLLAHSLPGPWATLVFPLAWTATEFLSLRLNPLGSWGALAYSQAGVTPLMQLASLTGIWGISFVMTWFASVASWSVVAGLPTPTIVVYACALAGVLGFGALRIATYRARGEPLRAVALGWRQPPLPDMPGLLPILSAQDPAGPGQAEARVTSRAICEVLIQSTRHHSAAGARLIVWPEASAPVLAEDEVDLLTRVRSIALEFHVYVLLGVASVQTVWPPRLENKAVLVDPNGKLAFSYRKARPVPGWEAQVSVPGNRNLPIAPTPLGRISAAVCFDLDFPALIRQSGQNAADLLLAPASDWQAITAAHASMATFRAVENGVWLLRAARWGRSEAVDPLGRVVGQSDHFATNGSDLVATIHSSGIRTVYARIGDAFAWATVLATLSLIAASVLGGMPR